MNETPHATRGVVRHRWDDDDPFGESLVVVSNRQPYRHTETNEGDGIEVDRPTGGLTAGLDPVVQKTGGTWVAWGDGDADRAVVDGEDRVAVPPDSPAYDLRRVWLSEDQVEDYYYGFSNRVLWPICHGAIGTVKSDPDYWQAYTDVNERFADVVAEEANPDGTVWFQDYHLALAPAMARRQLGGDPTFMQFWHVPWPSWDTFRACPHGTALLRGLLANDVLGFHVPRFQHAFLECVEAGLGDASVDRNRAEVAYRGSTTSVEAVPMGVPVEEISQAAAAETAEDFASFCESYGVPEDVAVAVGVDRLDYSKGIVERLDALEHLWETRPAWRGSLTYVQNGSESRSAISAYERVQDQVEEAVSRINDRFGTDDWQPVVYFTDTISSERLYGLFRHADLGLVSSVRDGLNLVALEFVASQVDGDGALVLSDQTGAHDLLGSSVYSVSPFDTAAFAATIEEALSAPASERRSRMETLRRQVAELDLGSWVSYHADLATQLRGARRANPSNDAV